MIGGVVTVRWGRGAERCHPLLVWAWCHLWLIMIATVDGRHYSSQWAAHIEGGAQLAEAIATRHGFTFLGEIFPDCYHLQHSNVARRSITPSNDHHDNLLSEREVKWARQQKVISRSKRDFTKSSQSLYPLNDPKWTQMWYLNRGSGLDMSVQEAWNEGVTGRGVVVTILDDGLERDHPDLLKNYDPQASYDVNNHDDDPMPRYDLIDSNRHGTRCAGEVAAVANNSLCSVGIAYNANIGGVRMLDGDVTDAVEARSLSLNPQHIDIYSASWGPDDDGKTVDGPGELAVRAFMEGVTKGRAGKGSIFIWASGNGGRDHDNCNCDGYTNSIWTLSISSATEKGLVPWYSEACSSTLATTYSSGSNGEKQVITTDLHRMCTVSHSGTSASAPLAAGICALALEANQELTWRDMQHIVVATAKPANLKAPDWTTNGVGRNVSHSFGYGLMDAAEMVKLARKWRTVPEQQKCEVIANHSDKLIPAKSSVTLILEVKECPGVKYLEHVQAKISLNSQRRGDLQIHLTSPAGTKSTLLARRPHDVSRVGFQQWPFMSVHTWGESPVGLWHLEVHNEGRFLGQLQDWNMMFYGTEAAPMSAEMEPRPSTIKLATKVPAPTKKPTDKPTEADKHPPQTHSGELDEVFNTVRDKPSSSTSSSSQAKATVFNAINSSTSTNSLICRRSTNICIGLCLIIFLVQFFFNDLKLPVRLGYIEKRGETIEDSRLNAEQGKEGHNHYQKKIINFYDGDWMKSYRGTEDFFQNKTKQISTVDVTKSDHTRTEPVLCSNFGNSNNTHDKKPEHNHCEKKMLNFNIYGIVENNSGMLSQFYYHFLNYKNDSNLARRNLSKLCHVISCRETFFPVVKISDDLKLLYNYMLLHHLGDSKNQLELNELVEDVIVVDITIALNKTGSIVENSNIHSNVTAENCRKNYFSSIISLNKCSKLEYHCNQINFLDLYINLGDKLNTEIDSICFNLNFSVFYYSSISKLSWCNALLCSGKTISQDITPTQPSKTSFLLPRHFKSSTPL